MNRPRTPRRAWLALPLAVLAFGLAACGPAAQPSASQVPAAEEKPQYGGTARLFGLSSPAHLDALLGASSSAIRAVGGIYEQLVNYDYADRGHWNVTHKVLPGLAERWEMSPDGKSYTFFLRKGVKFHDGGEFTAADVLFTYNRVLNEKPPILSNLRDVAQMEAPDPYTVKITTSQASVEFLGGLTSSSLGIQPKHAADQGVDFKKVAIGTGPFKLESSDVATKTVWAKNGNYWQKGLPYLDKVEVIWPLDKSGLIAAFVSGNIDSTGMSNTTDFQTLRKSVPNLQFIKGPYGGTTDLYLNIEFPAFKDVRVRRAINLAVDRQDLSKLISEELYLNCVFPSVLELCPSDFGQRPGFRQPKDQDIAEAKRLLAEAGYPNGFEFKFLYSLQYTQSVPLVEPFANYMARIGIKAIPDGRDTASWTAQGRQGTYDAYLTTMLTTEPINSLYSYYYSKGTFNKHGMGSARLDQLIDQQVSTFDAVERKKMLQEIEQIILDNVYIIPFVDATQYVMVQPWLKGPMVLNSVSNVNFVFAPVMGTAWFDQKLAPKR